MGKVIVGSEFLGVSKFALWYTLGVSFLAKKVHGVLLGFSFGLKTAFKVCFMIFISTSYHKLAAFRKI